jgi:hypothetical protein
VTANCSCFHSKHCWKAGIQNWFFLGFLHPPMVRPQSLRYQTLTFSYRRQKPSLAGTRNLTKYPHPGTKLEEVSISHRSINSQQLIMPNDFFCSYDLLRHNFHLTFISQSKFQKLTFAYNLSPMWPRKLSWSSPHQKPGLSGYTFLALTRLT